MIDASKVCLFIPAGLQKFKLDLFNRIAGHIEKKGGRVARNDVNILLRLPSDIIPVVGCQPESTPLIAKWRATKRTFIYWDRGYWDRVFATWLRRGINGGMYRWHINSFQLQKIKEFPADRLEARKPEIGEWKRNGKHIVIARPSTTYMKFHLIENWLDKTVYDLSKITTRQLVVRDKESKRDLKDDLLGAHALVTHGSNTAVESVILGTPVFVHPDSAAALVGKTNLQEIENPIYPDRQAWLRALSYSQFDENELVNGTLWKLIE